MFCRTLVLFALLCGPTLAAAAEPCGSKPCIGVHGLECSYFRFARITESAAKARTLHQNNQFDEAAVELKKAGNEIDFIEADQLRREHAPEDTRMQKQLEEILTATGHE